MRFVLTPLWVVFFVTGGHICLFIAFVIAVVAMISDALDGYYARKHKTASNFGKLADPIADAFFFVTLFLTFAALDIIPAWLAVPFVARELLQHLYVRPTALRLGVTMGAKLIGKIKVGVQCYAGLLVIAVEIVRSYDRQLAPLLKTHELFAVLEWTVWISVAAAAALSVISIIPYLAHLSQVQSGVATSSDAKSGTTLEAVSQG